LKSRVLLLAEDDDDHYLLFKLAWQAAGLTVPICRVTNGEGVLDCLQKSGIDLESGQNPLPVLIMLDIKMPGKDGLETLSWIRDRAEFTHTPVIMFSSSTHPVDLQAAKKLGANEYYVKPIGFDEFVSLLRTIAFRWLRLTDEFQGGTTGTQAFKNDSA